MAAPDSKQLSILKALTAHLEGITPANGYDYDLTGKVYRGRVIFGADETGTFLSILESPRPDPQPQYADEETTQRSEDWLLLVQGWTESNRENPTDPLYALKAAVEKRMAEIIAQPVFGKPTPPQRYLGGLITGMKIGPGVVRGFTPEVGGTEAFYLPLVVVFSMDLADPYSL